MDSQPGDGPNVIFGPDAIAFLDGNPLQVKADIIAAASWLYGDPGVDGQTKFLVPGPRTIGGVRIYRRVYIDGVYVIVYDFDEQSDPPLLTVLDASFSP